jgi:lysophospholipase L1-like esterase
LNPGDHILLLGDSIGEGIQMPLNQRIDDYGAKLTSLVKRGASAAYWADKITDADGAYEVVITTLGTNDIAGSYEQEGPALDRLLGHLESHGAPVYWVIPPAFRIGNFTERQAGWANMLTERGVRILDLQGPQPSTASDPMRVHLTPDGYKTLAAQIVDALTRS